MAGIAAQTATRAMAGPWQGRKGGQDMGMGNGTAERAAAGRAPGWRPLAGLMRGAALAVLMGAGLPATAQDTTPTDAGTGAVTPVVATATEPGPEGTPADDAAALPRKSEPVCRPGFGCVTNLPLPRFVSLKTGEGNARRGPGLSHRIDWVFTRAGMPLKITAEYELWRRVEDAEGAGGWVHYSLLSGVRSVLVTQDMAEFRAAPDDDAGVVMQAEVGVVGKVVKCLPDWCRISLEADKGWVRKSALWGVDAGEVIE